MTALVERPVARRSHDVSPIRRLKRWLAWIAWLAVIIWAFAGAGVSPASLINGASGAAGLVRQLLHPDLSPEFLAIVFSALAQTIQIAIVGLVLSSNAAFPLAIALAANVRAAPWLRESVRVFSAVLRGIPDLLWALLLVAAIGPGPSAGALAIAIHGTGTLTKLWAEQLEAVDARPVEALELMGAGRPAVAALAIVPQARAGLMSILLYQAECNTRSSTVLGFVGAGGIGQQLAISLKLFRYEQLSTLIIAVVLLILVVDRASRVARRRLGAVT